MRHLWEKLCALPHRGSATACEALAARKLKAYLEQTSPRTSEDPEGCISKNPYARIRHERVENESTPSL
jgi:hypothetical protein